MVKLLTYYALACCAVIVALTFLARQVRHQYLERERQLVRALQRGPYFGNVQTAIELLGDELGDEPGDHRSWYFEARDEQGGRSDISRSEGSGSGYHVWQYDHLHICVVQSDPEFAVTYKNAYSADLFR